jgi:23S rRNA pseudouridine1911/1915/1917 synthase
VNIKWTWKIPADFQTPERADRVILHTLELKLGNWEPKPGASKETIRLSRNQLHRLMEDGHVTSDGQPLKPNTKLRPGNQVVVEIPQPKPLKLIPEEIALEILFEDEHIVVLNKPPGLTVHPSKTQSEGTLVHALLHYVKDLSGIGGVLRPGIVHRLDKDTSGAMVITKTDAAHKSLAETFSKHAIERHYWALCYGSPKSVEFKRETKIETLIGRNPNDRKKMSAQVKTGRKAVTWLKKLEEYAEQPNTPFASLLEARLETGRTHQVRVHLTSLGNSILGDPVYGVPSERAYKWLALPENVRDTLKDLPGQALHARVLGFDHPITAKHMRFEANPPAAFCKTIAMLRLYKVK